MQKIILVVLFVGIGLLLGNFFLTANLSKNLSDTLELVKGKTKFVQTVQELEDSQLLERFTFNVLGEIKDIKNRTLTVERQGSTLNVAVARNAETVKQSEGGAAPEMITFQELQVGDEVLCHIELKKDGSLSAYRVKVY